MPKTKTKTKGKGKGLTKKVGPFPIYVYAIGVGIVILYLYFRHKNSSATSSDAGSQNQSVIPSGIVVPQTQGVSGDSGNNGQSSDGTVQFPTDYATQTDLGNAVSDIESNTAASIAAITFPQPNINITVPKTSVSSTTTKSKTAAKKAAVKSSAPIKYFTYKTQVKLKAGQTLHFTKGKGYYAA